MSYGDYNFAHDHGDTFRALLFWCTLLACVGALTVAACRDVKQPVSEPAAQHAPRNLPEGNMHLLR